MKTSASKAAVLEAGHLESSLYSHVVNGKGGKQPACNHQADLLSKRRRR